MKKLLALALIASVALPLVGCSSAPADEPAAPVDKSKDAETPKDSSEPAKTND